MFIGHWAPALVAATNPRAPRLATLFIAAQLVDWAFFALVLADVEHMRITPGITVMIPLDLYHMPYTHSLLGSAVFAAGFAGVIWFMMKDRVAALIGGAVVLSHWFLDLLVHTQDLTLMGSPPKLGLALWDHPAIEMPLELGITFGAMWLYARSAKPAPLRLAVLAAVMLLLQAVHWFGPADPEVTGGTTFLAFFAYGLITLVAWWVGKSAQTTAAMD